jgi:hypothetical protein
VCERECKKKKKKKRKKITSPIIELKDKIVIRFGGCLPKPERIYFVEEEAYVQSSMGCCC